MVLEKNQFSLNLKKKRKMLGRELEVSVVELEVKE